MLFRNIIHYIHYVKSGLRSTAFQWAHFVPFHISALHYRYLLITFCSPLPLFSVLGSFWRPHWCLPAVRFAAFTVNENFLSDLRCKYIWELIQRRNLTVGHGVHSCLLCHLVWVASTFKNSFWEKLYSCSQCSKLLTTSSGLQVNLRIQSGWTLDAHNVQSRFLVWVASTFRNSFWEKPYSCSQCSDLFITSSWLLVHLRIHSGVKPYSCSQCSKSFWRSDKISIISTSVVDPGSELFPSPIPDANFCLPGSRTPDLHRIL